MVKAYFDIWILINIKMKKLKMYAVAAVPGKHSHN